ncbi:hypothetical protein DMC47_02280 [Nostoc sp. 3335mG]|nr:hypothetical protein DMC47_02280 [Nostoc sp. 3335mG]
MNQQPIGDRQGQRAIDRAARHPARSRIDRCGCGKRDAGLTGIARAQLELGLGREPVVADAAPAHPGPAERPFDIGQPGQGDCRDDSGKRRAAAERRPCLDLGMACRGDTGIVHGIGSAGMSDRSQQQCGGRGEHRPPDPADHSSVPDRMTSAIEK